MAVPDFSKIWASQSPLTPYEFSDEDYLDGWEFLGEIPPDRRMFDAWQRQADTKMQWLKNNMLGYLLRQNSTQYAVGDVAFTASLPSYLVLECTTPGTTAATEPDFSGAAEGGTVTDGEVTWTYKSLLGVDGANKDLSNLTQTGKQLIVDYNSPDYANGISWTYTTGHTEQTYTAPSEGFLGYTLSAGSNSAANASYIKVNGVQVVFGVGRGSSLYIGYSGVIRVSASDEIKVLSSDPSPQLTELTFYPLKEAI